MQWPPTPGPGVKRMKPNGLVAAASMTSHTSRPIRSHSSASWFTNAMLTLRNVFSSSLAISAASGDESWITRSLMPSSSVAARAVAAGVDAADQARHVRAALAGSPGLTRSGAKARSKSRPATRPDASSTVRNGPVVVPGKVVDWRMISWPARSWSRMNAAAARTAPRSGSLVVVIGVGTHTNTASISARAASGWAITHRFPLSSAAASRSSVTSSMGDRRALSWATRSAEMSMPWTRCPASANAIASGRPT